MSNITKLVGVLADVRDEVVSAQSKHAPLHSLHEAYAIILEEVDELWDQVKLKRSLRNDSNISLELTQIAAMAVRAKIDLGYLPVASTTKYEQSCQPVEYPT